MRSKVAVFLCVRFVYACMWSGFCGLWWMLHYLRDASQATHFITRHILELSGDHWALVFDGLLWYVKKSVDEKMCQDPLEISFQETAQSFVALARFRRLKLTIRLLTTAIYCCCETVGCYIAFSLWSLDVRYIDSSVFLVFIRWWHDLRCDPDVKENDWTCWCRNKNVTFLTNDQLTCASSSRLMQWLFC